MGGCRIERECHQYLPLVNAIFGRFDGSRHGFEIESEGSRNDVRAEGFWIDVVGIENDRAVFVECDQQCCYRKP